jgi:hypothetical protein
MKGIMKKIFVLIFLSVFVISCTNEELQENSLNDNNKKEMTTYNE